MKRGRGGKTGKSSTRKQMFSLDCLLPIPQPPTEGSRRDKRHPVLRIPGSLRELPGTWGSKAPPKMMDELLLKTSDRIAEECTEPRPSNDSFSPYPYLSLLLLGLLSVGNQTEENDGP